MRHSGRGRLGQSSGKATYDQGNAQEDAKTANYTLHMANSNRHESRMLGDHEISESPNESSNLPIDRPSTYSVRWLPHDKMGLVIIIGMLLLILISLLLGNSITDQLISALTMTVGFYFGKNNKSIDTSPGPGV